MRATSASSTVKHIASAGHFCIIRASDRNACVYATVATTTTTTANQTMLHTQPVCICGLQSLSRIFKVILGGVRSTKSTLFMFKNFADEYSCIRSSGQSAQCINARPKDNNNLAIFLICFYIAIALCEVSLPCRTGEVAADRARARESE